MTALISAAANFRAFNVAKFSGYSAAQPSATRQVGSRIGTNLNTSLARVQMAAMQWTAADLQRNAPLAMAYLRVRGNYCRSTRWKPNTGDSGLNRVVSEYLKTKWKTMGVACSMQSAVARTLHIETPIRGDAGLILWRDASGNLRLIEFSADQLGEVYGFVPPRKCSLRRDSDGNLQECSGSDCTYFAGRYFQDADCVAYKIFERQDHWYGRGIIHDAANVIYTCDPFNFRGMRGITIFHAVMDCIQTGEGMIKAGLAAAWRQAKTSGMVFNNSGTPYEPDTESEVGSDGRMTYFERIHDGPATEYFYNGDSAMNMAPNAPGEPLLAGVDVADQRFCIGLGMTYAFVISGEKIGGAISRLDANRSSNEIERIWNDLSEPTFERIAQLTILNGCHQGDLPMKPGITKGRMGRVPLPIADAYKDSMDDIKSVRAGQDSDTRVLSRYDTTPEEIMRDKEDETFLAYESLDRVQKRLKDSGITLTPSIADIRQISDNPQQAAAGEQIDRGNVAQPVPGKPQGEAPAKQAMAALAFDDSEKRDEGGKWTDGGGTGGNGDGKSGGTSGAGEYGKDHQWITDEGKQTVPLSKKINLGSEVVWKDKDGKTHHGQLMNSELDSGGNPTGKQFVTPVTIHKYPHPKLNATVRELRPVGHAELDKAPKILLSSDSLRQLSKSGFRSPDFTDKDKLATASLAFDDSKHPRGQPGNAGEFGKGGAGMKSYMQKQATHLYETAQSKGHADVNEFAEKEPQEFSKTIADFQKNNPREGGSERRLTPSKERAWNGKTVETKTKLSKLETGAIGEKAVIQWLKDNGNSDARPYDTSRNNAPIDLLQDHELYEVKTGLVSNGDTAQHWRATIGQPSPAEAAWLKTASKDEKKEFNLAKSHAIEQRKTDELAAYSKRTGRKAKGKMICTHLNPDTKTIDIYEFDGFKLRIPWNSPDLQGAYRGSYKYA